MTPSKAAPVAVAVVSWNTAELLDRCLESLRPEHDAGRAEVWVVDNASTDGSAALVAREHPWARLEAARENLGFGPAVDLVAARTRGPFLAAANADIAPEPGALAALLAAAARHPRAGVLAPRLIAPGGTTQHSVHPFPTVRTGLLLSTGLAQRGPVARRLPLEGHWNAELPRDVDWAHGAFLLVRRTAWDAVGGFDPVQWLHAEDLDLAWRLRAAGWATRYVPEARVRHEGSAATAARWSERELDVRAQRSAYAWMLTRRGAPATRATAMAHLAGPAVRLAAFGAAARVAPERWGPRAATQRRWVAVHRTGLTPRAELEAHRARRGDPGAGRRIAVLVDHFPELSETFVAAEASALQALGARVRIEAIVPASHPDPTAAAGLHVHDAGSERPWERLAALLWLVRRAPRGCGRDLADRWRWREEEEPRPLRALAPTARRIAQTQDEHLHAHFGAGAALDALRLGRLLRLPYSVTLHGYDIFATPRNLREKLERAAFATSGSAFTVGHLQAVAPEARVHLVVMGVDAARWQRTEPPAGRGVVLAVGRLVEKKGFAHLLRAAAQLRGAPGFSEVLIVGDGPLRGELEALHAELDLGEAVRLLGPQPPARVRELMEEATVLAVPSVIAADGDADSMPVVAKEALAMEVPVVAFAVAGLPEVVRPPWGRTVAERSPSALAAALREVLALPPERRAAMGAAGRRHIEVACSVDAEAARLLALVDAAVLDLRGGRSA